MGTVRRGTDVSGLSDTSQAASLFCVIVVTRSQLRRLVLASLYLCFPLVGLLSAIIPSPFRRLQSLWPSLSLAKFHPPL
ncbi:hypothetical protein NDU88_000787 [Pleurodeles waltl]|uniref:Uncharacterized protein n=1 Tax=Pleurodeles waltl TaxID=8319 RepID=A0AAV7V5Z4_PLEWA|nr:hypothetical protein NDU88_000787 [Pleurodeles waltl]